MRRVGAFLAAGSLAGGLAACVDSSGPQLIAAIDIQAPQTTLAPGQSVPFAIIAVDPNGRIVLGYTVQWSSSNASVATVTGTGVVIARGDGQTWIRAEVRQLRDSVQVTVEEPTTGERPIGR